MILFRSRDLPGQRSVFVPQGNMKHEWYRRSSFKKFTNNAVDTRLLAKVGFYYTGYTDRVKCFSCEKTNENWVSVDDVTSSKWHYGSCQMMLGENSGNVPLSKLIPLFMG